MRGEIMSEVILLVKTEEKRKVTEGSKLVKGA